MGLVLNKVPVQQREVGELRHWLSQAQGQLLKKMILSREAFHVTKSGELLLQARMKEFEQVKFEAETHADLAAKFRFMVDFLQKIETAIDQDEDDKEMDYFTVTPTLQIEI